ncbi:aminotransferase [Sphingosinicella sp. CPCC 101087]|uniref:aminotransferase n=1 Tax=Sphingosinicella sp. CPCC 101087 TaxID=2497754 RepID=UPI00101BE30E|nr:aminotransferase [Sphingosinicella sp. CPCC 101087]
MTNPLFADLPITIFDHMSGLARALGAVNLGQGFPDFGWPEDVLDRAAQAVRAGSNQYAPMRGLPELREAVAAHYRRFQGLELDAGGIIVTSGATEALASALLALIEPGDEVVLFQPLYDAYLPLVRRAGGVPRLVKLAPPDWRITGEALAAAFTTRTRLVVFNNPHNPTSRLFDREELALLAEACLAAGAIALTDEVWEHVVFDGRLFLPLSALPGMAERTVKVGSAGKIFSLTGWKVGWIVAPPALADVVAKAHQFVTYSTAPNLQTAVAYGLSKPPDDLERTTSGFAQARDHLRRGLEGQGFVTLAAEATYFLSIDLPASGIAVDDVVFCERAVHEAGVAAIPVSAFYTEDPVISVVRLCFAKKRETLDEGIERLGRARALFA